MKNPIPKNELFATPESGTDLWAYIDKLSGTEKALAYTIAIMTLNLSSKIVDVLLSELDLEDV